MAVRREEFTPSEALLQDELTRSWEAAQGALADSSTREGLLRSIERVNKSTSPVLTRDQFLLQTASLLD